MYNIRIIILCVLHNTYVYSVLSSLFQDSESNQEIEGTENRNTAEKERSSPQNKRTKKPTKKGESNYDFLLTKAADAINKPTDDFQIFADYVACELRNLRSAENQRLLKLAIQRSIIHYSEIDGNASATPQSYSSFSRPQSAASYISEFTSYEEGMLST